LRILSNIWKVGATEVVDGWILNEMRLGSNIMLELGVHPFPVQDILHMRWTRD